MQSLLLNGDWKRADKHTHLNRILSARGSGLHAIVLEDDVDKTEYEIMAISKIVFVGNVGPHSISSRLFKSVIGRLSLASTSFPVTFIFTDSGYSHFRTYNVRVFTLHCDVSSFPGSITMHPHRCAWII